MGQARSAQLVRDPEDPLIVGTTGGAARGSDELDIASDGRQSAKRGSDPIAVEIEDLGRNRWVATGLIEEGRRLAPADPGDVLPALLVARLADALICGAQVEGPGGLDGRRVQWRCGQPLAAISRHGHQPGQLQPVAPVTLPRLLVDLALALRLEDFDSSLGQVDRPASGMADDDLAPAARTQPAAGRWRIEDDAAVRAGDRRDRRGRHDRLIFGYLRLEEHLVVLARAVLAEEPPEKPDLDHLGSGHEAPGKPENAAVGCRVCFSGRGGPSAQGTPPPAASRPQRAGVGSVVDPRVSVAGRRRR
jgi:hypothetical protein